MAGEAADSVPAEVRLYNPLFAKAEPDVANFANDLNPNSLEVLSEARYSRRWMVARGHVGIRGTASRGAAPARRA